ncbi:MAG: hypothetical protein OHK0029_14000 [Armatimonadaceae bacterium]
MPCAVAAEIPVSNRRVQTTPQPGLYAVADWLAQERRPDTKQELHDGKLINVGGGTFEHNAIRTNYCRIAFADSAVD